MSKIIKAELENFQSHKSTVIEFDKGLNVITGPSDSGKSAIIRAIRWVLYNEPRGVDFISTNTAQCRVSLTFESGTKIVRERAKTKNRYILFKDGEEQVFEGFGNGVPQEIIDSHQIRNIFFDTDQKTIINLSSQLEGPFLLSESGAIRAKAIGRILGIHFLDSAARKASSTVLEYKKEYTSKLDEHTKVQERLQGYKIYEHYSTRLETAEKTYLKLESKYNLLKNLRKLSEKLNSLETEMTQSKEILQSTSNIQILESTTIELNEKLLRKKNLEAKVNVMRSLESQINHANMLLQKTDNLAQLDFNIADLNKKYQDLKKYRDLKRKHGSLEKEIKVANAITESTKFLSNATENHVLVQNLYKKLTYLSSYNEKLSSINRQMATEQSTLKKCNSYPSILKNIEYLILQENRLTQLQSALKEKYDVEGRIHKGKVYLSEQNNTLNKLLAAYKQKLSLLQECPICETVIDNQKTSTLVQKYKGVK